MRWGRGGRTLKEFSAVDDTRRDLEGNDVALHVSISLVSFASNKTR